MKRKILLYADININQIAVFEEGSQFKIQMVQQEKDEEGLKIVKLSLERNGEEYEIDENGSKLTTEPQRPMNTAVGDSSAQNYPQILWIPPREPASTPFPWCLPRYCRVFGRFSRASSRGL